MSEPLYYEFVLINQWINALNFALFLTRAPPGCLGQAEARRRKEQLSTRPNINRVMTSYFLDDIVELSIKNGVTTLSLPVETDLSGGGY